MWRLNGTRIEAPSVDSFAVRNPSDSNPIGEWPSSPRSEKILEHGASQVIARGSRQNTCASQQRAFTEGPGLC